MALAPGTRLGSYEIVAAIGAGGMGEVYKAHDARLGRDVAVKVLPGSFAADPDRSARFDREARLLASLNHPNIAQIYGLERAGDVPFIVMELIDGETLSDRLRSGALPVREALTIAAQIADGLDAAHARGIVHRDLKPSNVAVTRGAQVKILDFGLATTADAVDSSLLTHSPTMLGQTASGVLLGTAPYMSPEQARGKAVDKRTDIWAFGCVLFEMLTGKAAFSGPTVSDAIARVLEREPDWTSLPGQVDPSIRRVLRRCLQKELKERFHDVADVRLALADAADGTHTDAARNAHPSRTPWIPILALVAIALAVTTWMSWRGAGAAEPRPLVEFGINLGDNAPGFGAALSPDGRRVAVGTEIAGRNQIWMHAFDGSAGGPLPGGEYGIFPFWSPDGSALAFFSFTTGTLSRVPASGGSPTKICATNDSIVRPLERRGGITGGSWNAAGAIIFGAGGRLFRVPAAGGVPVRLATPGDADESVTQSSPQFLPDGQHFVYVSTGSLGEGTVAIGSLDGAPVRRLARARRAAFVAPGLLLLLQGTSLTAQRFDASALKLQGEPSVVAANVGAGYVDGTETFDARDNLLVFVPMLAGNHGRLTWFDRSGHPLDALRPTDPSEYLNPVLSPRGDRVAVNRLDFQTGIWNVWAVDVARDTATRITNGPNDSTDAVWSPDESELAFTTRRDGHFALVRKRLDSAATEEELLQSATPPWPNDWSKDSKYIVFTQAAAPGVVVYALPVTGSRTPIPITDPRLFSYGARLSPDGRWIAYASNESGQMAVYVQRFLEAGQRTMIAAGVHPRWTHGGRELVYWTEPGGLNAVSLTFDNDRFAVSAPKPLVSAKIQTIMDGRPHHDVSPDGERFLIRQTERSADSSMTAVLNWTVRMNR